MLTFRNVFAEEMRKLLSERVAQLTNDLAYGASVTSIEVYREKVGQIRGLHDAAELVDEAELKADERERGV